MPPRGHPESINSRWLKRFIFCSNMIQLVSFSYAGLLGLAAGGHYFRKRRSHSHRFAWIRSMWIFSFEAWGTHLLLYLNIFWQIHGWARRKYTVQLKIFVEKKSRLILYSLDLRTHRGRPSASRTHIPNQDLPPPSISIFWDDRFYSII